MLLCIKHMKSILLYSIDFSMICLIMSMAFNVYLFFRNPGCSSIILWVLSSVSVLYHFIPYIVGSRSHTCGHLGSCLNWYLSYFWVMFVFLILFRCYIIGCIQFFKLSYPLTFVLVCTLLCPTFFSQHTPCSSQ